MKSTMNVGYNRIRTMKMQFTNGFLLDLNGGILYFFDFAHFPRAQEQTLDVFSTYTCSYCSKVTKSN